MYLITLPVANSTDIILILYNPDGVKFHSIQMTAAQFAKYKAAMASAGPTAAIVELK